MTDKEVIEKWRRVYFFTRKAYHIDPSCYNCLVRQGLKVDYEKYKVAAEKYVNNLITRTDAEHREDWLNSIAKKLIAADYFEGKI